MVATGKILIPRWVVYFQGALLGISAITFFIFGLMVGNLNNPKPASTDQAAQVSVSGTITTSGRNSPTADAGAVVLLLPETPGQLARQSPASIQPDSFQPLENPTIDHIRSQGGEIVRANLDGKFEFFVGPGKYFLLVVSNSVKSATEKKLTKEQVATLSQYFLPLEELIGPRGYYWEEIVVDEVSVSRDEIRIESN